MGGHDNGEYGILFINKNHFIYLELQNYNDIEEEQLNLTILNRIEKNLLEWEKIIKKEYPLSLKLSLKFIEKCINF